MSKKIHTSIEISLVYKKKSLKFYTHAAQWHESKISADFRVFTLKRFFIDTIYFFFPYRTGFTGND